MSSSIRQRHSENALVSAGSAQKRSDELRLMPSGSRGFIIVQNATLRYK